MPSPERCHRIRLLLVQEIRNLLPAPPLWIMLLLLALLVGYSFLQAEQIYSQASQTARSFPQLAAGMQPLTGIFVPTFGAYYLSQTLLLPFVAIRLVGMDRQSGALKLLLQLKLAPWQLAAVKLAVLAMVWAVSLVPALSALGCWLLQGGHIHPPEILLLLLGHGLYSLVVITLAMFAATVSDSLPTAAMICLALTLGSWVLDFAASGRNDLLATLGAFSFTGMLHQFETGLLATPYLIAFLTLGLFFFLLTMIWLHPGQSFGRGLSYSLASLLLAGLLLWIGIRQPVYLDVTENQVHSLAPNIGQALKQLDKPLVITIHLHPEDSRLQDLQKGLLAKLRRRVPQLKIRLQTSDTAGLFAGEQDPSYGLIEYEYAGRHDQSYSNSRGEILPIIFKLAQIPMPEVRRPPVRGYPLVTKNRAVRWWFYLVLPLLLLASGYTARRLLENQQLPLQDTPKYR